MSQPVIHELYPYLCVGDARAAIDFYTRVFGAREDFRLAEPGGRIGHAELKLGSFTLMLSEEFPEIGVKSPLAYEGNGFCIHLHVDDCDALATRAVDAGATLVSEPTDQFYGERSCRIRDPFGHVWLVGHSIEKVAVDEMQRRYDALFEAGPDQ